MSYKTETLLTALDCVIESAHHRLNPAELQLLANIRTGIVNEANEQVAEKYFITLIEFILLIKNFFDNT